MRNSMWGIRTAVGEAGSMRNGMWSIRTAGGEAGSMWGIG